MDHAAEAQRTDLMTITRHVLNEQSRHPESRGDFTILLSHIVLSCKFVASAVNKAGLAKLIGLAGETNVQASKAPPHASTRPDHPSTPPRLSCADTRCY
jgi:fructose-1,6-bisphosphatase I